MTLIFNFFQIQLANALNRSAFYYTGVSMRGGSEEISVEYGHFQAMKYINESISIFKEVSIRTLYSHHNHRLQLISIISVRDENKSRHIYKSGKNYFISHIQDTTFSLSIRNCQFHILLTLFQTFSYLYSHFTCFQILKIFDTLNI